MKRLPFRKVVGVTVFDLHGTCVICSQAPLGHIERMGAEVCNLASRVVVVEAEVVKAAVLVVRRIGRWAKPEVVVESIWNRHWLPAGPGTGFVNVVPRARRFA